MKRVICPSLALLAKDTFHVGCRVSGVAGARVLGVRVAVARAMGALVTGARVTCARATGASVTGDHVPVLV